jgi:hypothetical protein
VNAFRTGAENFTMCPEAGSARLFLDCITGKLEIRMCRQRSRIMVNLKDRKVIEAKRLPKFA